jgi:two-component sensor histidine kinase
MSLHVSVAGDKTVASQLQAAAARVMTVGAVHRRLWEKSGAKETNAMAYLEGLITDMSGLLTDRETFLRAPPVTITAPRLAPLGLVTAELVSNALRNGRGRIDVAPEDTQDALRLTVDDEGSGFPETFATPQGTGQVGAFAESQLGCSRMCLRHSVRNRSHRRKIKRAAKRLVVVSFALMSCGHQKFLEVGDIEGF